MRLITGSLAILFAIETLSNSGCCATVYLRLIAVKEREELKERVRIKSLDARERAMGLQYELRS
jgi:hypothetical protein